MDDGPVLSEMVTQFIDSTFGYNAQAFSDAPSEIKNSLDDLFTDIIWCIFIFIVIILMLSLLAFFVGKKWYLLILLAAGIISGLLIFSVLGLIIKADIYGVENAIENIIQPFTTQEFKTYIDTCGFNDQLAFICTGQKL